MDDTGKSSGCCMCGAVKFNIETPIADFNACHCHMCRRWTSSPWFATDCGKNVQFEGEENIGRFKSSNWAERGFCKICGSSLFYHLIPTGHYMMSVGTFDNQNGIEMKLQAFMDEKPDGYDFTNQNERLTGQEVFEKYAPKD